MSLWSCIFIAVLLDGFVGDPPNKLHPVAGFGRLAAIIDRGFGAQHRGLLAGGMGVLLAMTGPLVAVGLAAWVLPGPLLVLTCLWLSIAPHGLMRHALPVLSALRRGDVDAGRTAVSRIVGRDSKALDETGLCRACIETVAENTPDAVLAPLFWASVGGALFGAAGAAVGAVAYRMVNTLDAMWGKPVGAYAQFGTVAAKLDDALTWIPARLCWLLTAALAAFLPQADPLQALRVGWRDRRNHASPNSAWAEAAFAGALGARLGGPIVYPTRTADYPWIGEEFPHPEPAQIATAVWLMWANTAWVLLLTLPLLWVTV